MNLLKGRAPQIAANYANKSTGELSMMTQVLMSAGSVARIFTTVQEGGSTSMIGAYVVRGKVGDFGAKGGRRGVTAEKELKINLFLIFGFFFFLVFSLSLLFRAAHLPRVSLILYYYFRVVRRNRPR